MKQPLALTIISGVMLFGLHVFLVACYPHSSTNYFWTSLPIAFIGLFALIWEKNFSSTVLSKLWANLIKSISWSSLLALVAYRALGFLIPKFAWFFGISILGTIIFSYSFPAWNPEFARLIKNELSFFPKTKPGRMIRNLSLFLLPAAGVLGGMLGLFGRIGGIIILEIILGLLCWFLAIGMALAIEHPLLMEGIQEDD